LKTYIDIEKLTSLEPHY